jgi:hypothetical protein
LAGKDGEPELAFALSGTRPALAAGASPGPSEFGGSGRSTTEFIYKLGLGNS